MSKVIVKLKHDTGTVKISVWANSIEEAINKVLQYENAPNSAVIYAKVTPHTIHDIKRETAESSPYFFSTQTLKFFKQKLSSFSVKRYGNDKFYIYANYPGGTTQRIYNPFTKELERLTEQQEIDINKKYHTYFY